MPKIIVITSGKGGVGKTTTTLNLGAALNYFGEDVLIIDANLSTPNIGIHLGSPEIPINLNHILSEKAEVIESVYEHESGLKIILSSLSLKELQKVNSEKMKNFKKDFAKMADYIIVDSAAGLGIEARSAIELADELIIVTNPELPAITDALKTIKLAEQMKKPVRGVIVTRVCMNDVEMYPKSVKEMLEVPILGMIPEDINVKKSQNMKDAVVHTHPKSKSAKAYKEIAAKMIGIDYNHKKDKENFWKKILNKIGIKN